MTTRDIVMLAAVINGLGIVLLVSGIGEYLKKHAWLNIQHYWAYTPLTIFQLLTHLLLWWSLLGVMSSVQYFNFLSYLYLLTGPILLYLGTRLIIPEINDKSINLYKAYYAFRKTFYSIMAAFWLWVIFVWPVFGYPFPPTVPLFIVWLLISMVLRFTDNPKAHAVLVTANLVVFAVFIAIFAMQVGEVARSIVE